MFYGYSHTKKIENISCEEISNDYNLRIAHIILKGAHSQVWENFGNWKPFKNDEKLFLFSK